MHPHPDFLHCHSQMGLFSAEGQLRCPRLDPGRGPRGAWVMWAVPKGQECEDEVKREGAGRGHEAGAVPASAQGHFQQAPRALAHSKSSICVRPVPRALSRERSWGRGQVDCCH